LKQRAQKCNKTNTDNKYTTNVDEYDKFDGQFFAEENGGAGGQPTNTNAPNLINVSTLNASSYYLGTAMSADGKYILICKGGTTGTYPFLSSNNGVSFAGIPAFSSLTTKSWQCCAMSSTGKIMVIAGNSTNIYKSTDFGFSWTPISDVLNWMTLHLSYTGQYCLATSQTASNVSSTVFNNFVIDNSLLSRNMLYVISDPSRFPQSAYVSSSGKYMIVTCFGLSGGIATSSNYGFTWETSNYGIGTQFSFWGATITYDETKIYIGVYSGTSKGVYILPITGGAIGTTATIISSYTALATSGIESILVSRDGTYIIVSNNSTTHYSKDSGATWTLCYTGNVQCSSMSEGAKTVITTSYNNEIPKISKT